MEATDRQRERSPGLRASLGEFVRWLASISLVTAGITAVVVYFIQTQLDEEIRRHVEAKIQLHYAEHLVSVGSARRVEGRGIEIRGMAIGRADAPPGTPPIVFIDELLVRCGSTLADLASGQPKADQVIVRRARIRTVRQPDGTWDLAALLPLPKFGDQAPPIAIEDGAIELIDASLPDRTASRWSCREIQLAITPQADRPTEPATPPLPPSAAGVPDVPPTLRIQGSLAGDFVQRVEVDGQWDPSSGAWSVMGRVIGAAISPALLTALPGDIAADAEPLRPLHGLSSLAFRAAQADSQAALQFAFQGEFRGRVEDHRLPQSLDDARATYGGNETSLWVSEFSAVCGEARLHGSCAKSGWQAEAPWTIDLHAEQLALERRLWAALPAAGQEIWDRFQPEGLVDAHITARFDGTRWTPDATLVLRGTSFAYEKFPYRMTDGRGRITLRNNVLSLDGIEASAGRARVKVNGEITNPGPDHTGWVEIATDSLIPIDQRLLEALPEKSRRVVRSLNPHGLLRCWGRIERPTRFDRPHSRFEIGLAECSVTYDEFAYPIYKISGRISVEDNRWSFQDLEGYNDSAFIVCSGGWELNEEGEGQLDLNFNAMDVPLEEELRAALGPEVQRQWNHLHPRGSIDQLRVAIRHTPSDGLSVDVTAHKQPPSQNVEGRSITIKPAWLRYRMDNVVGTVRFHNGVMELQNIRAVHGETDVRLSGRVDTDAGGWRVQLDQLHIDRLTADHELITALPHALGQAIDKLNLDAPVNMSGRMEMVGLPGTSGPDHANWLLTFDIENGRLDCGVPLEHIHGGLTLAGAYQRGGFESHGRLEIDSLMYKGVQLTNIRGPLSIDSQRLGFGLKAALPPAAGPPQPVVARVFGNGTLAANAEVFLTDEVRFQLTAGLEEADLASVLRETASRRRDISVSGRAMGDIYLTGTDRGMHALKGHGRIRLTDADIYELPLMIRLLKLLTVKPPDLTAFTSADMEFRIEEDQVYFDRLDFNGDAISLAGRGEMNMQRAINLTFDTSVGRDDNQPLTMLVRPLLKEAGKRLLVLHVGGTLDDPIVRKQPFPELNQTIQQVFPAPPTPATGGRTSRAASVFDRFAPRR